MFYPFKEASNWTKICCREERKKNCRQKWCPTQGVMVHFSSNSPEPSGFQTGGWDPIMRPFFVDTRLRLTDNEFLQNHFKYWSITHLKSKGHFRNENLPTWYLTMKEWVIFREMYQILKLLMDIFLREYTLFLKSTWSFSFRIVSQSVSSHRTQILVFSLIFTKKKNQM